MTAAGRLEIGLYSVAGALLLATFTAGFFDPQQARTKQAGEAGLDTLLAAERTHALATKQYAPFGPAAADMTAALPGVTVPQASDFAFDAVADKAGTLHVRAVTRPEAVAEGRVFPMLLSRDIGGAPPAGSAGPR